MSLAKLVGLCYVTDELVEDVSELARYLTDAFEAEFRFKLENAVINAGCLVSISKETGQAADTIVWENVKKLIARFGPMNPNSVFWVANQDTLPELLSMYQAIGTGGVPVYQPGENAGVARVCGWPVIYSEASPTLGDKGELILMDGSSYLMIDKAGVGIQQAFSIHVRFTDEGHQQHRKPICLHQRESVGGA